MSYFYPIVRIFVLTKNFSPPFNYPQSISILQKYFLPTYGQKKQNKKLKLMHKQSLERAFKMKGSFFTLKSTSRTTTSKKRKFGPISEKLTSQKHVAQYITTSYGPESFQKPISI